MTGEAGKTAKAAKELTGEQIREILCAPEGTDAPEDIDFEDFEEADEGAELRFVEDSIRTWLASEAGETANRREGTDHVGEN